MFYAQTSDAEGEDECCESMVRTPRAPSCLCCSGLRLWNVQAELSPLPPNRASLVCAP